MCEGGYDGNIYAFEKGIFINGVDSAIYLVPVENGLYFVLPNDPKLLDADVVKPDLPASAEALVVRDASAPKGMCGMV